MDQQTTQPIPVATPAEAFDFTRFEDVPSGTVRIKDPQGRPTLWVIELAGPEHPDRKRRVFDRQRRLRALMAKSGRMPVSDPQDDEAEQLDDLVAFTLGWTGAAVPFSRDAARALYGDPRRQWVKAQVLAALEDREAFTRSSAPT